MTGPGLLVLVFALFSSAFFSGSETAVISANRVWITHYSTLGSRWARFLADCLENPSSFLTTVLVGTNLSNVVAAALAADMVVKEIGAWAVGPASILLSLVMLFACEVFPKTLGRHRPNFFSRAVAYPLWLLSVVLHPLSWTIDTLYKLLARVIPHSQGADMDLASREGMRYLAEASASEGLLHQSESEIIGRVMALGQVRVEEVMIPLTEAACLSLDEDIAAARRFCARTGHSHYPVYRDRPSQIVGVLEADRLLWAAPDDWLKELLQPPFPVDSDAFIDDFLPEMQSAGEHLAVVRDGEGKTVGIVTLRDLIEEVVGKIT